VVIIRRITRSLVEFERAGHVAKIEGEALLRGHGSPDFVLFQNTLARWEPPYENELIQGAAKQSLLLELVHALRVRGMTAEIE
jgi:hypothetical protein